MLNAEDLSLVFVVVGYECSGLNRAKVDNFDLVVGPIDKISKVLIRHSKCMLLLTNKAVDPAS